MANKNCFSTAYISIADIYLAYRKAKSEAFFDSFHPSALAFAEFEQNLQKNLEELHKTIIKGSEWWIDSNFIGDYLYVPKSIDDSFWDTKEKPHYRSLDPYLDWTHRYISSGRRRLDASYRLIIAPTVSYQVLSALWILKVGHKFEVTLDKNYSYGNRLRRRAGYQTWPGQKNGALNEDALGLFTPYFSAYQKWRNNGLTAMRELTLAGENVTAITMDLARFYHRVSPNFLTKPSFLKLLGIELSQEDKRFTNLLIDSINYWYKQTPDFEERPEGALPVGLSASKIISNVLLYELDKEISSNLSPGYYGRYVDDLFIVFLTPPNVESGDAVVDYLSKKVSLLKLHKIKGKSPELRLKLTYASDSNLLFTPSKQKIFNLSSEHGIDLINQISGHIRAQSSEYRMLPEVPSTSVEMAEKALLATPDASLIADALRKADAVSVRRLGLSLLIRDIESYSTDLSRSDWLSVRLQFYGLVHRYLITPKGLFDLFPYYRRVFQLMVANCDFEDAENFIRNLSSCFELIEDTTSIEKGRKLRILSCKAFFEKTLLQTALQASTTKDFKEWSSLRKLLLLVFQFSHVSKMHLTKPILSTLSNKLLLADLGTRPYKDFWYYHQNTDINKVKITRIKEVELVLRLASIRRFRKAANLKRPHWPALAFPTRPLTIQEIALIAPGVLDNPILFKRCIFGLRGAKTLNMEGVRREAVEGYGCCISVPKKSTDKIYIALTNFETTDKQFLAALHRTPDRSLSRYEKVNTLVNSILRTKRPIDYVVFPECSIPRRWAMSVALKLARQNISLIAGIEYYKSAQGAKVMRNDCLVSLATRWPGYSSNLVVMQPKLLPAHEEEKYLRKAKAKLYFPKSTNEILPLYQHGNYHFGILICSDLTNPQNRFRFQGKVDTLFVLEWNCDVNTFSYLIEGTSHDIHTFVVQVNNRRFGDSRVRAPYRSEHQRDSVRLKGGIEDFFVVAEIDFQSLRKFQRRRIMTDKNSLFKPAPIGFEMSKLRKKI